MEPRLRSRAARARAQGRRRGSRPAVRGLRGFRPYETPAESGCSGTSADPHQAIAARHANQHVLGISCITNKGAAARRRPPTTPKCAVPPIACATASSRSCAGCSVPWAEARSAPGCPRDGALVSDDRLGRARRQQRTSARSTRRTPATRSARRCSPRTVRVFVARERRERELRPRPGVPRSGARSVHRRNGIVFSGDVAASPCGTCRQVLADSRRPSRCAAGPSAARRFRRRRRMAGLRAAGSVHRSWRRALRRDAREPRLQI